MPDDHGFGAELVTPESALFAGAVTAVICRTSDGFLTVLDGHMALVGDLVPGVVRIELADAAPVAFCVHGGFVQVRTEAGAAVGLVEGVTATDRSTRVTVLAGIAESVGSIDAARAQLAREAAAAKVVALAARDDDESRLELEQAERALARAELRLEVAGASVAQ